MSGAMTPPEIGIGLAAYRPDPAILAEQLASIAAQTYPSWACVITLDSPLAELRDQSALKPFFTDPRFHWHENAERRGHKKNFEAAIQAAVRLGVRAVGCSDQDDIWYPEKLAVCADALAEAGPLALVHADMHVLRGGKTEERTAWEVERRGVDHVAPAHLLIRNVVAGCSMLMDAELARRYPVIPEGAQYHDHWYALAASFHGGVHAIRRPLMAYRQHGGNVVGVSPFQGIFALPPGSTPGSLLEKCRSAYARSRDLAAAAQAAGMPLGPRERRLFLEEGDHGVRLLGLAFHTALKEPALTRASLARAAGKLLKRAP
jgi:hypothetical protein